MFKFSLRSYVYIHVSGGELGSFPCSKALNSLCGALPTVILSLETEEGVTVVQNCVSRPSLRTTKLVRIDIKMRQTYSCLFVPVKIEAQFT